MIDMITEERERMHIVTPLRKEAKLEGETIRPDPQRPSGCIPS